MVIVSQKYKGDKIVKRRVVNFSNINYLMTEIMSDGKAIIVFKDNTMKEEELINHNCILGIYATEERAEEVLQEIINTYKFNRSQTVGQKNAVYEMPEE